MEPKNERPLLEHPRPAEQRPAPRKRFRIEKLEERIAPKKCKGCSSTTSEPTSGGASFF